MKGEEFLFSESFEITQPLLKNYSQPSGDFNPIHLDPNAAQKMGLRAPIAHGMLLMGLANKALITWQSDQVKFKNWKITHFETRFMNPVYVGQKIFFRARIQSQGESEIALAIKTLVQNEGEEIQACQGTVRLSP